MINQLWYEALLKPLYTPPNWVFQPAWIVLYITILLSFVLFLFSNNKDSKTEGLFYFILQLVFNILWTPSFFYLKNPPLALLIIIILDIFVIYTIKEFYKISKVAGLLLIPYFLWLIFATYLNLGIVYLNPLQI